MSSEYDKSIDEAYTDIVNALIMGKTAALVGVQDIDVEMSAPADATRFREMKITAKVILIDQGGKP